MLAAQRSEASLSRSTSSGYDQANVSRCRSAGAPHGASDTR